MAQSAHLSVEHSAVSSHEQSLQDNHQTLQDLSRQFLDALEPLKSSWKGAGVNAWDNMTQAWNDNMEQVNNALDDLSQRVGEAGKAYQNAEDQQAEGLQQKFAGMQFNDGPIL